MLCPDLVLPELKDWETEGSRADLELLGSETQRGGNDSPIRKGFVHPC